MVRVEGRLSPFPPWQRHRIIIAAAVTVVSRPWCTVCSLSSWQLCGGLPVPDEPATAVQGHPAPVHLGPALLSAPERGPSFCFHSVPCGCPRAGPRAVPRGTGPVGLLGLDLLPAGHFVGCGSWVPGDSRSLERGSSLAKVGSLESPAPPRNTSVSPWGLLETAHMSDLRGCDTWVCRSGGGE